MLAFEPISSLENPISKVVVVGEKKSGKTSLLHRFASGKLSLKVDETLEEDEPLDFETQTKEYEVEGNICRISLWDTSGLSDYGQEIYSGTTCFIVCVPVIEFKSMPDLSLQKLREKIIPEIRTKCPDSILIICGTKTDLREEDFLKEYKGDIKSILDSKRGEEFVAQIDAFSYVECSALTGDHIQDCVEATLYSILQKLNNQHQCIIN